MKRKTKTNPKDIKNINKEIFLSLRALLLLPSQRTLPLFSVIISISFFTTMALPKEISTIIYHNGHIADDPICGSVYTSANPIFIYVNPSITFTQLI